MCTIGPTHSLSAGIKVVFYFMDIFAEIEQYYKHNAYSSKTDLIAKIQIT